ncbi:Translation initiation factor 2 [hydrothermal vent metagenome]|uniref:Translation initiation factor 2 n=1 Tax=hydrothermal vent metagenome TaxID=652676 RepID=A0A1W1B9Z9_9ZZZZ
MSEKVRVYEVAHEVGLTSKEVVAKAQEIGIQVKSAQNAISMQDAEELANFIMNGVLPKRMQKDEEKKPKKVVKKASLAKTDTPKQEESPKEEEKNADKNGSPQEAKKQEAKQKIESEEKEVITETKELKDRSKKSSLNETTKEEEKTVQKSKDDTNKKRSGPKIVQPQVKRKGLTIVKKKRPAKNETEEKESNKQVKIASNYGKLGADVLEELQRKKKPKKNSDTPKKKESGVKIDMFGDIGNVSMDFEEDQIELIDINMTERKEIQVEEPKKREPRPIGRNSGKKQGGNRPRKVAKEKKKKYKKETKSQEVVTHIEIPEDIRVYEFAEAIKRPMGEIIKVLFDLGIMATKNDFLKSDEIEILSEEFGVEVTVIDPTEQFNVEKIVEEKIDESNMVERPPIITIMGHVDHGKTSLLDKIRSSKVADKEAGGITQHIGAYTVEQNGKEITFLDTPGHAAFSNMRQRGTDVTDIVIIVVAADDGVKPQTEEVIKIAKESGKPIIVAMNKIDKPTANPDMVKAQMAEKGITPVDWGGDVEFVPVSAKTGEGIDELLENILLTAEVLELKADPTAPAKAVVVESSLEKGRGPVATVIVQNGTLKKGNNIVCGIAYGRVKALINENGKQLNELSPSHTAVVVGLDKVPPAGEVMAAVESDKKAKELAQKRYEYERHKELSKSTKSTLEDMTAMIAEGKLKTLKIVLKADVHGSLEAIKSSLEALRNDEVKVEVIQSGVGGITENDVELVAGSENTALMGFNVRPTGSVKALAKQKGVDIRTYNVIYQLLDDVTGMLTGMMAPKWTEEQTGQAEVRDVFKSPKGMVAGCLVVDGKLIRGGQVRVIREGVVAFEGELVSLRRFKDDVEEVGNGYECGVIVSGYDDVRVGDVIETFRKIEQKVEL